MGPCCNQPCRGEVVEVGGLWRAQEALKHGVSGSAISCKKKTMKAEPVLFCHKKGLLPHGAVYTNTFYVKSPN